MKLVKSKDLEFVPASHEDQQKPGVVKKVLFTKADLFLGQAQMINWAILPVGEKFRRHFHEDMQEAFIVVGGKAQMEVEGAVVELTQGDALLIPPRAAHQMKNIGKEECAYIVIGISLGQNGKTVLAE